MPSTDNSADHHWWPVALQKLWANKDGSVSFLLPNGTSDSKKYKNRQMGMKRRAHHVNLGNSPWTHTFEKELFDKIDNTISELVPRIIRENPPFGSRLRDWPPVIYKYVRRSLSFEQFMNFSTITHDTEKALLLLIISLLVRSPAFRSRRMALPISLGFMPDENIGSINVEHYMRDASRKIEINLPQGFWVFFRSIKNDFCYGDGMLDTLSDSFRDPVIHGRFLLPLTPRVCIFYFTANLVKYNINTASTYISDDHVDHINNITKIYSKSKVYFRHKMPQFDEYFSTSSHDIVEGNHDEFLKKYENYIRSKHCAPLITR